MPPPVVDEVRSADLDRRVSAFGARLRLLLGSRPSDAAGQLLFDELGELPLSVVEASANRLVSPAQASAAISTRSFPSVGIVCRYCWATKNTATIGRTNARRSNRCSLAWRTTKSTNAPLIR